MNRLLKAVGIIALLLAAFHILVFAGFFLTIVIGPNFEDGRIRGGQEHFEKERLEKERLELGRLIEGFQQSNSGGLRRGLKMVRSGEVR